MFHPRRFHGYNEENTTHWSFLGASSQLPIYHVKIDSCSQIYKELENEGHHNLRVLYIPIGAGFIPIDQNTRPQ